MMRATRDLLILPVLENEMSPVLPLLMPERLCPVHACPQPKMMIPLACPKQKFLLLKEDIHMIKLVRGKGRDFLLFWEELSSVLSLLCSLVSHGDITAAHLCFVLPRKAVPRELQR